MRSFLAILIVVAIVPCPIAAEFVEDLGYVPGMVIARFRPSTLPSREAVFQSLVNSRFGIPSLDRVLESHSVVRIDKLMYTYDEQTSAPGRLLERTFVIYYSGNADPQNVVDELLQLSLFEDVTVNHRLRKYYGGTSKYTPSDTKFPDQWNLQHASDDRDIDAPEAWYIERGQPSVVISIIDTGTMVDVGNGGIPTNLYQLHNDNRFFFNAFEDTLPLNILGAHDLNSTDGADQDFLALLDNTIGYRFPTPPSGITDPLELRFWQSVPHNWIAPQTGIVSHYDVHGVHVASIAAAKADGGSNIAGVANNCSVYILRDGSSATSTLEEANALRTAADFASVINMSWGFFTAPPPLFELARDYAIAKDCVLVAISGNTTDGPPGTTFTAWPGRYTDVLCVGNMDSNLSLYPESRYGPDIGFVDVVAPVGAGIPANSHSQCSPHPCDILEETVDAFGGTSAAAPQVAGLAALVRSRFPSLNQQQVRNRINNSAQWYWGEPRADEDRKKFGNGKINAYRALTEWGSIATSTTWSTTATRDGKYYVSGDLTIKSGATLTINPGVIVKVAPDHDQGAPDATRVKITVESGGALNVLGTPTNKVTFEGFTDSSPTAADWTGIHFESGSAGNLTHVNIRNAQLAVRTFVALTINSCTIENGVDGIQSSNNLVIRNSVIQNCSGSAVSWLGGNLELRHVEVTNCSYGVNQSASVTGTFLSRDLNIHDVTYRGLNFAAANGGATIRTTTVEDATDGIVLISSATIDSCSAKNNDIGIYIISSTGTSVRRSSLANNTTTGLYLVYANSVVELDTISSSAGGVYCNSSSPSITNSRVLSSTVGLKCESNSNPFVRTTRISSGGTGVLALSGSTPDLGIADGETCGSGSQEGRNSIHNNSPYNIANLDAGTTVTAQCNWFGVGTPPPQKFYGNVVYTPYRSSDPNPAAIWDPGDTPPPGTPISYGLHANRPNPFNPVTSIGYEVPPPGARVEIVVYDVSGRRIRTLVSAHREPGTHRVTWEGRDEGDSPVASGVYFVRMNSGTFTQTRKVVLLK